VVLAAGKQHWGRVRAMDVQLKAVWNTEIGRFIIGKCNSAKLTTYYSLVQGITFCYSSQVS